MIDEYFYAFKDVAVFVVSIKFEGHIRKFPNHKRFVFTYSNNIRKDYFLLVVLNENSLSPSLV